AFGKSRIFTWRKFPIGDVRGFSVVIGSNVKARELTLLCRRFLIYGSGLVVAASLPQACRKSLSPSQITGLPISPCQSVAVLICLITEKSSDKPRGYAFIEYEHERDMHSAYKHADGKKIDGRRVLVDVERGRTVKGWRPRRLGGGLGGTRKGGPDENTRFSGRDDYSQTNAAAGYEEQGGAARGGRERSRSRERGRKERVRSRSRERSERRRGGSRDRDRRGRSRSKERERRRRSEDRGGPEEEEEMVRKDKKRGRRSRSRDRKRSRSPRDRKRSRRSRSRDRGRRSRERRIKEESDVSLEPPFGDGGAGYNNYDNSNGGGGDGDGAYDDYSQVRIKQEPSDEGYPGGLQVPMVPVKEDVDAEEEQ
ncbi:hypothetical protein BaRGS_00026891, partial [Batillaria attramentaria]